MLCCRQILISWVHTSLDSMSRGVTKISVGVLERALRAWCWGVSSIMEKMQRTWGASLLGSQVRTVDSLLSSNYKIGN